MRYEETCVCGSQLVIVDACELGDQKEDLERRTSARIMNWREGHICSSLDASALDAIQSVMSGMKWDSDTMGLVATIIRNTDREVLDV